MTFRARLILGYWLLLVVAGAVIITVTVLALQLVPEYDFSRTVHIGPGGEPVGQAVPGRTGAPPTGPSTISSKDDLVRTVLLVSIGALAVVSVVGLVVARLLADRMMRPVRRVSRAAAAAGAGDLEQRIDADGPADEIRELADTFDAMLARLQTAFETHRRFAANASHELLTPLAANRTALQLLADPATDEAPAERAELHETLRAGNERSIAIVRSLLRLAEAENSQPTEPVDLATLTAEIAPPTARIDLEPVAPVRGDPVLLRQLLTNLVDNARRHGTPGGDVTIRLCAESGRVRWSISNPGPTLDAETARRIFEPFHRVRPRTAGDSDPAGGGGDGGAGAAGAAGGHGLGLAIARAIAEAHRGMIHATPVPGGGLTVQLDLPAAAPQTGANSRKIS